MSSLKDQIYADMITAMKARESVKTEALKMIKAEIMKYETSSADIKTTDEDVQGILKRAIKQRKEAAEGFTKGGNTEMADKELQEAAIYEAYLPEQMGEEQIKALVQAAITELGATGPADMGKVMKAVIEKAGGQADGKLVNQLVKAALG